MHNLCVPYFYISGDRVMPYILLVYKLGKNKSILIVDGLLREKYSSIEQEGFREENLEKKKDFSQNALELDSILLRIKNYTIQVILLFQIDFDQIKNTRLNRKDFLWLPDDISLIHRLFP